MSKLFKFVTHQSIKLEDTQLWRKSAHTRLFVLCLQMLYWRMLERNAWLSRPISIQRMVHSFLCNVDNTKYLPMFCNNTGLRPAISSNKGETTSTDSSLQPSNMFIKLGWGFMQQTTSWNNRFNFIIPRRECQMWHKIEL